jgi:hypothetical protein
VRISNLAIANLHKLIGIDYFILYIPVNGFHLENSVFFLPYSFKKRDKRKHVFEVLHSVLKAL